MAPILDAYAPPSQYGQYIPNTETLKWSLQNLLESWWDHCCRLLQEERYSRTPNHDLLYSDLLLPSQLTYPDNDVRAFIAGTALHMMQRHSRDIYHPTAILTKALQGVLDGTLTCGLPHDLMHHPAFSLYENLKAGTETEWSQFDLVQSHVRGDEDAVLMKRLQAASQALYELFLAMNVQTSVIPSYDPPPVVVDQKRVFEIQSQLRQLLTSFYKEMASNEINLTTEFLAAVAPADPADIRRYSINSFQMRKYKGDNKHLFLALESEALINETIVRVKEGTVRVIMQTSSK